MKTETITCDVCEKIEGKPPYDGWSKQNFYHSAYTHGAQLEMEFDICPECNKRGSGSLDVLYKRFISVLYGK